MAAKATGEARGWLCGGGGCRTGEGRRRAKANGVRFGRKPKLTNHQRQEAMRRRASGEPLKEIAASYAVSTSMISRL
jgi:DNA invertase Pin-like site-specific DNA recombinase